jgi:hypothetical protein
MSAANASGYGLKRRPVLFPLPMLFPTLFTRDSQWGIRNKVILMWNIIPNTAVSFTYHSKVTDKYTLNSGEAATCGYGGDEVYMLECYENIRLADDSHLHAYQNDGNTSQQNICKASPLFCFERNDALCYRHDNCKSEEGAATQRKCHGH